MENETKDKIDFACIACGSGKHIFYTEKANYKIWKCKGCGMLSLFPLPELFETKAVYEKEYFAGGSKGFGYIDYNNDKEAMRGVFEEYLNRIAKISKPKGEKLLDIGAATGFFLKIARSRGYEVSGIEISDYAASMGRKDGLNITTGTIQTVPLENNKFDVVTMWDVIEHLHNPKGDLSKINSRLKKGGILAINTPDCGSLYARLLGSKWHLLVPPEHIYYFNKNSLKLILEKTGFEVIGFSKIGKKFTLEYVFHMLAKWLKLPILQKFAEFLGRSWFGKISMPINLKDNMIVFANKI